MRINIIGENDCARATRHLLQHAGFAVTEFLPADAAAGGPLAGYAITIELAPAHHTPDFRLRPPNSVADGGGHALLRPDSPAHQPNPSAREEAPPVHASSQRDASSPASVPLGGTTADMPAFVSLGETSADVPAFVHGAGGPSPVRGAGSSARQRSVVDGAASMDAATDQSATVGSASSLGKNAAAESAAPANFRSGGRIPSEGWIHFDSVDSKLEAAVLRHVTQLAAVPVVVDRPGGVVHSDRELRIVAPNTGDAKADEAAAVAIEFRVLRGLLDLTAATETSEKPRPSGWKKWWPFGIALLAIFCGSVVSPAKFSSEGVEIHTLPFAMALGKKPAPLWQASFAPVALSLAAAAAEPAQGQFATGPGLKITDGTNFLTVDPCQAQAKSYASINQTANAQLVTGTTSKKIYVCSIQVVTAAATNVAVVEGTGTVCGTGTVGVSGFGGPTAATGWSFAGNGGIALGNGESSVGAVGTSGDNLCIFNSGSSQVSGGISYVVQ